MVNYASSDGQAPSVICVKLGDRFEPNVHFFQADGRKGIKGEGCWSAGGILEIVFGEAESLPSLGNMTLKGFFGGVAVLAGVSVG